MHLAKMPPWITILGDSLRTSDRRTGRKDAHVHGVVKAAFGHERAIDPAAFGGAGAFTRQTGWIAAACRTTPPRPGVDAVRLPGERALAHRREALDRGLALYPGIMHDLAAWPDRFGVAPPRPIGG
jgi:LDH2 family malate/lactate/ureidoglycolate dehydrogenase